MTGLWKLTQDLTSTESCIEIKSDNVILDCDGHSITGDSINGIGPDVGIHNLNYNLATINLEIQGGGKGFHSK